MAYSGSTASSTLANPPIMLMRPHGAAPGTTALSTAPSAGANVQGGGLWYYCSTNLTTDLTASNFFSDGYYLGMRPGDVVMGAQFSSAGSTVTTFVGAIVSVSTSGASLSTGSLMTSTFG